MFQTIHCYEILMSETFNLYFCEPLDGECVAHLLEDVVSVMYEDPSHSPAWDEPSLGQTPARQNGHRCGHGRHRNMLMPRKHLKQQNRDGSEWSTEISIP